MGRGQTNSFASATRRPTVSKVDNKRKQGLLLLGETRQAIRQRYRDDFLTNLQKSIEDSEPLFYDESLVLEMSDILSKDHDDTHLDNHLGISTLSKIVPLLPGNYPEKVLVQNLVQAYASIEAQNILEEARELLSQEEYDLLSQEPIEQMKRMIQGDSSSEWAKAFFFAQAQRALANTKKTAAGGSKSYQEFATRFAEVTNK